jgi:hypothetical protein
MVALSTPNRLESSRTRRGVGPCRIAVIRITTEADHALDKSKQAGRNQVVHFRHCFEQRRPGGYSYRLSQQHSERQQGPDRHQLEGKQVGLTDAWHRKAHRPPGPVRWASPRSIEARPTLQFSSTTASTRPRMLAPRGECTTVDSNRFVCVSCFREQIVLIAKVLIG